MRTHSSRVCSLYPVCDLRSAQLRCRQGGKGASSIAYPHAMTSPNGFRAWPLSGVCRETATLALRNAASSPKKTSLAEPLPEAASGRVGVCCLARRRQEDHTSIDASVAKSVSRATMTVTSSAEKPTCCLWRFTNERKRGIAKKKKKKRTRQSSGVTVGFCGFLRHTLRKFDQLKCQSGPARDS
jgi:hypothetical protein